MRYKNSKELLLRTVLEEGTGELFYYDNSVAYLNDFDTAYNYSTAHICEKCEYPFFKDNHNCDYGFRDFNSLKAYVPFIGGSHET